MLYSNKRTLVSLCTSAVLFALNNAAKLDQCCISDCESGSDEDSTEMSDAVADAIASMTAEFKALQDEFT